MNQDRGLGVGLGGDCVDWDRHFGGCRRELGQALWRLSAGTGTGTLSAVGGNRDRHFGGCRREPGQALWRLSAGTRTGTFPAAGGNQDRHFARRQQPMFG